MPGFGLVINKKSEILLIQRGYGNRKGQWSLPGGQRDKGESLRDTAVRETREETGITMSSDHLYYRSKSGRLEVWLGKRISGRLKVQRRECLDAEWFQRDMLPHDENLAFGPDIRVIAKWAAENSGSRRVYYPRSKMRRAGFALAVNENNEILLIQRKSGRREGKWSLPGGNAQQKQSRLDAAIWETLKSTGLVFMPEGLYYENRHRAEIWLGRLGSTENEVVGGRWFSVDNLPDDASLAFAVDVRTVEKWSAENNGSHRISYS